MTDDNLSKAELQLIDKIVDVLSLTKFKQLLWNKIRQAFGLSFQGTQLEYGFARGIPDPLAIKYLEERIFILSDKTQAKLRGDLRWELLEGMRNVESTDAIKRRLDKIFEGNTVNTERIARTEVLNAQNAGRLSAYEASDVVHYKMWKAAMNNSRTAADSKRLNGQIQKVGDSFIDPKTGDANMHPPNRPFCRCTMIPLRKLPENIVYKGGQMYDGSEMVGKIEIDIGSLNKSEKRIWIKPTTKRKGHYRKIKGGKDKPKSGIHILTANELMIKGSEPIQIDVDKKWRDGIDPNASYKGQCYDKAGEYAMEIFYNQSEDDKWGVRLVHGTVEFLKGTGLLFGHAWVEISDNIVLDLTSQGFYDKKDYYKKLTAVGEVKYTVGETLKKLVEKENYGPWHDTKGMIK